MAGKHRLWPLIALAWITISDAQQPDFVTSDQCIACHSNMLDADGNALSIGHTWRASMMSQSAKDPYWQAAVRRELADHPQHEAEIEDTCSVCHMPMFRTMAVANGGRGEIVRYLEGGFTEEEMKLAEDGVSCTVCHQISAENFGDHASFGGGYIIERSMPGEGTVFGPYEVEAGLQRVMHSAATITPGEGAHIQESELCATCHTLFTPVRDGSGNTTGEFAEQVPYLEWQHSDYAETRSCQDCHMPVVEGQAPISSVLGEMRDDVSRHVFRGGNAFMLSLLDKYRDELNVTTPSVELQASKQATLSHLQSDSAAVEITDLSIANGEVIVDIQVENLAGHKLPTAYPSRRAWLHVVVSDEAGNVLFESGAMNPDGSIAGNDNDSDGNNFEPHYDEINSENQVQIYEPIVHDYRGEITTSLLSAATYAKDNRLLPHGFYKETADDPVRVVGEASSDDNFTAGTDRIRYRVAVPDDARRVNVSARLMYQTIGYRWASNLRAYDSYETNRFTGYYADNAVDSAVTLAEGKAATSD